MSRFNHSPRPLLGGALSARVSQFGTRSFVKSIQSGSITISSTATSNTATINTVDPTNTVLILTGRTSANAVDNQSSQIWARITLTNATTVTANRTDGTDQSTTVYFTVVEFYPGVIKSIQRGTISLSGTSNTATITAVDTTKATVMDLGSSAGVNSTQAQYNWLRSELTNATTVTVTRATGVGTFVSSYQVVEFF